MRVKSTKPSKSASFNLKTYGNALADVDSEMPDEGNATKCEGDVGLYRVTYDYDPKNGKVTRRIALISAGGSWGNDSGAANVMMEMFKKQEEAASDEAARKAQEYEHEAALAQRYSRRSDAKADARADAPALRYEPLLRFLTYRPADGRARPGVLEGDKIRTDRHADAARLHRARAARAHRVALGRRAASTSRT